MRIPHKINLLSLQKGPDRFETGYGLLSRSRFDSESVRNEKIYFCKKTTSGFEKSLMMHFFLLAHSLKVFRRVEFLQRSEVRSGIGAHIVEQIDFLDRDFP